MSSSASSSSGATVSSVSDDDYVHVQELNANSSEGTLVHGVKPTHTVGEVKELIRGYLEDEDLDDIDIAFAAQLLLDDDRTLASYDVQKGDDVLFSRSSTPGLQTTARMISNLFITNFDGKTFRLSEIPSWWTVAALKERVGLEGGYDAGTLRFLFGGKHLESERTLESYSISNDNTLHLVSRVRGGGS